jgi:hypothetical protein
VTKKRASGIGGEQQRGSANVHVSARLSCGLDGDEHEFENPRGSDDLTFLVALGLLLVRRLRQKYLVSGEVSALDDLGRARLTSYC